MGGRGKSTKKKDKTKNTKNKKKKKKKEGKEEIWLDWIRQESDRNDINDGSLYSAPVGNSFGGELYWLNGITHCSLLLPSQVEFSSKGSFIGSISKDQFDLIWLIWFGMMWLSGRDRSALVGIVDVLSAGSVLIDLKNWMDTSLLNDRCYGYDVDVIGLSKEMMKFWIVGAIWTYGEVFLKVEIWW